MGLPLVVKPDDVLQAAAHALVGIVEPGFDGEEMTGV
jgi:hypothetical protein